MYFVKVAFWIFLVLLLMPSNDREKSEFYVAAGRTMSDLGSFCSRNPQVCDMTTSIVDTIVQKVRTTVQMLDDMVRPNSYGRDPRDTPPPDGPGDRRYQQQGARGNMYMGAAEGSQNTLSQDDMRPVWRGPGGVYQSSF